MYSVILSYMICLRSSGMKGYIWHRWVNSLYYYAWCTRCLC